MLAQAVTGDRFDDQSEHVGRQAVFPRSARVSVGISFMRLARASVLVGEAGRMPQQILDGEFAMRGNRGQRTFERARPFMPVSSGRYLPAGSLGVACQR